jgi:hypothetical protein
MIRNLGRDFFKWLLISRCDLDHGSGVSQPRPAGMGPASGNIRAMKLLMPLWFFRRSGAYQKKIPAATPVWRRILSFCEGHSAVEPCPL